MPIPMVLLAALAALTAPVPVALTATLPPAQSSPATSPSATISAPASPPATPREATPPPAMPPPADDASAAADPTSTAVNLRERDTRMTVAVTIDGAGPFRFIVDSGATRTVISSRLANLLALPAAGTVSLSSVGGESAVPSVRIAALTLGGLPARPIVAPVLDEANLGALGILGIDALAGKKVVIDLVAHRMSIAPADARRAPAQSDEIVVVARRRYGQLVFADADAAGQRIWAIVDTGSMVTIGDITLQDRLISRKRATMRPIHITDVAGRDIVASYAPLSAIRLSNWHLANVLVAFADVHAFERFGLAQKPAMLLGMDVLQAFTRVSIDFARRTVRLQRAGGDPDQSRGFGVTIRP